MRTGQGLSHVSRHATSASGGRGGGGKAHKHPDLGVPIGHITSNGRRRAGEQRSQFSASWLCVRERERAQLAHPPLAVISSATSCANSFRTSLRTNFAL
jgi:hypothetical protein